MKIDAIAVNCILTFRCLAVAFLALHSLNAHPQWASEYLATGLGNHACFNCTLSGTYDNYYKKTLPLDYPHYYPIEWDDNGEPIANPWWIAGHINNSIHVSANNGVLKAYISSSYSQPSYYGDGSMMSLNGALTKAYAQDNLTIESASNRGKSGTMIFALHLDWIVERSPRAEGRVWAGASTFDTSSGKLLSSDHIWTEDSYWLGGATTYRATFNNLGGQNLSQQSGSVSSNSVNGLYLFSIPVVYGERFGFEYNLSASAGGVFSDPYELEIRANHSAEWAGILTFLDEEGNKVLDAKVFSEIGFDWSISHTTQVPENSIWALMLIGILVTAAKWQHHVAGRENAS